MRALHTAATGMMAQELNVQVISNNIANMRTTGYKRQRAEFQDLLYEHVRRIGTQTSTQGNILPVGIDLGGGVKTVGTARLMTQGTLSQTGADLRATGDTLFAEPPASGPPQDGVPNTDGMGDLQQGNLEQANVEAVTEISDLIPAQRAHQMNAKVITAADQMLSATSNLMR